MSIYIERVPVLIVRQKQEGRDKNATTKRSTTYRAVRLLKDNKVIAETFNIIIIAGFKYIFDLVGCV